MFRSRKNQVRQLLISPTDQLRDAISVIESGRVQFAGVIDGHDKLIGTVTDGDVRRALLRGKTLSAEVATPFG